MIRPFDLTALNLDGSNWKALLLRNSLQCGDYHDVPLSNWLTFFA